MLLVGIRLHLGWTDLLPWTDGDPSQGQRVHRQEMLPGCAGLSLPLGAAAAAAADDDDEVSAADDVEVYGFRDL